MNSHQYRIAKVAAAAVLTTCCLPNAVASRETHSRSAPSAQDHVAPDFDSLVKALKGRWETLLYHGNPVESGSAQDAADHGEEIWRTGPGGLTLIEEEHVASRDGDQYVLALHWWDRSTNTLKGMLCNNSGPGACNVDSFYRSKLNWDGKRLTVDLVFPQGPKLMLWHEEFGDFTGTSFTQTGDMGEVGGPLKRVITVYAKRVGDIPD